MKFGEKLKFVMEIKNVTQKELAEILNISPSTLNGYINTNRQPDFDTVVNIASALDVTTDYLLSHNAAPQPNLVSLKELNMLTKLRTLAKTERNIIYFLVDKFYNDSEDKPKDE